MQAATVQPITVDLDSFKQDCAALSPDIIVQKYLIEGSSYFFESEYGPYEEFEFKKEMADCLGVHIRDIAIVGSGKLGFSLKPDRDNTRFYPYRKFDELYTADANNKKSDIDVAIISSSLFDQQVKNVFEHTNSYQDINAGGRNQFAKYIVKGSINPETLPSGYVVSEAINTARSQMIEKYGRDVNFFIYKSWFYFEKYHGNNINTIKLNMIASN